MTKDETKALLQRIHIHYPRELPKEYMAVLIADWYKHLAKYDVRWVVEALDQHLQTSPYPPKIYDMVNQLKAVEQKVHRDRLGSVPQLEHHAEYVGMPDECRKKWEEWK